MVVMSLRVLSRSRRSSRVLARWIQAEAVTQANCCDGQSLLVLWSWASCSWSCRSDVPDHHLFFLGEAIVGGHEPIDLFARACEGEDRPLTKSGGQGGLDIYIHIYNTSYPRMARRWQLTPGQHKQLASTDRQKTEWMRVGPFEPETANLCEEESCCSQRRPMAEWMRVADRQSAGIDARGCTLGESWNVVQQKLTATYQNGQ